MQDLPEYIHLQIVRYLQFSPMWNLSLVCKHFNTILNTRGICDSVYRQRWNCNRTDTTMNDYLEKARHSTATVKQMGSRLSCNRWKLEKDENDFGSTIPSSPPSNSKKIEYDDFDEEILPDTDDFGDEIREEGKSAFEEEDFVSYAKEKRGGFWVTFEATTVDKFRVEFLENFIDCEPVIAVLVDPSSVKIIEQDICVKEVLQEDNPKARLNTFTGFQKYWASIDGQILRFGRGNLGDEYVIEWKGSFRSPTHVGLYTQKSLLFRYLETSGCNYLDYGLDDSGAEIAFAGEQSAMEVQSSNWDYAPDPGSAYTSVTVVLTAYSENSNAFDIALEPNSKLPLTVHVTPSQIQIYDLNSTALSQRAKFPRMQSRYGHYWVTFKSSEVCIGVTRHVGTSQIGKLLIKDENSAQESGRVSFSCFKISGAMMCKLSNIRILWE